MMWATRSGIHIDRSASAWLISRFIDDSAEFVYVDDPQDIPPDATPFDVPGCELSHRGTDITFETILRQYNLDDPVLWQIAEIIHEADLDDEKFNSPEGAGFDLIARALGTDHNDEEVRQLVGVILTSTEKHLRSGIGSGGF